MDPITSAIVVALGKLAEPVVRDSYEAVKKLVTRKLGADNPVSDSIQHLERRPDSATRQADVAAELTTSKLSLDAELLQLATQLATAAGAQTITEVTTVNQSVTGSGNIFSGTGSVTVTGPKS